MKSVIAALTLILSVLIGGGVYTSSLVRVSNELSEMNAAVQSSLENNYMESAEHQIEQMRGYLEDKEEVLSAMGDHDELDEIKMNIAELEQYVKGKMKVDALAKSEVLEFLLEHMPENYRLKLRNVL